MRLRAGGEGLGPFCAVFLIAALLFTSMVNCSNGRS